MLRYNKLLLIAVLMDVFGFVFGRRLTVQYTTGPKKMTGIIMCSRVKIRRKNNNERWVLS